MPTPPKFLPKVIVKFKDAITSLPYADDIGGEIQTRGFGEWNALAQQFPGIRIRRSNPELDVARASSLVERAAIADPEYQRRNLHNYYVIDCPPSVSAHDVAEAVRQWPSVEAAYVAMVPTLPTSMGYEDPPLAGPPPSGGVNAVYAHGVPGGQGDNQFVADLELGWTFNHDAISHFGLAAPQSGQNSPTLGDMSHGTSTLGVVAGQGTLPRSSCSSAAFVGIAPNTKPIPLSFMEGGVQDESLIPARILDAIVALPAGGILLIEVEINGLPAESRLECFDWIRLATALGIVVVEPAGNNGAPLDAYQDPITGKFVLNRTHADFKDSGAIVVGAGSQTHQASSVSMTGSGAVVNAFGNYGSRLDCWAWGDGNVCAPKSTSLGDVTSYGTFDRTSAASAIVAGAAASVQGMMLASAQKRRFSPGELRAILSDPNNGTYATGTYSGLLGVMPDLEMIARNVLNIAPDVYGRDYVGDPGDPNGGAYCTSPDIIVRNTAISGSPQTYCGEGSTRENDDQLSDTVKPGQNNYIYVRLRNRGGRTISNVDVDVYYAAPATLIVPADWKWIGRTTVASIPNGNQLTVSNAITWPAANIPAGGGHYCFIAIAGSPEDPAPPLAGAPPLNSWDRFLELVGRNNNVTWRNFFIQSPEPDAGSPLNAVALPFDMAGAPDQPRAMRLEVKGFLPSGSALGLEAPISMLSTWGFTAADFVYRQGPRAVVPADPSGVFKTPDRQLAAAAKVPLRLHAQVPAAQRDRPYIVMARQIYQDREVGRVTWCLQRRGRRRLRDVIRLWRPFDWG